MDTVFIEEESLRSIGLSGDLRHAADAAAKPISSYSVVPDFVPTRLLELAK